MASHPSDNNQQEMFEQEPVNKSADDEGRPLVVLFGNQDEMIASVSGGKMLNFSPKINTSSRADEVGPDGISPSNAMFNSKPRHPSIPDERNARIQASVQAPEEAIKAEAPNVNKMISLPVPQDADEASGESSDS